MRRLRKGISIAGMAFVLAGCVARAPAPVVDRRPLPPKPVAAAPVAAAPAAATYVVKRGETLYSIALDQGMDWRELAALNDLSDPAKLSAGQVLRLRAAQPAVPGSAEESGVVVNPIATAPAIEARPLGGEAAPPAVAPPAPVQPSAVPPPAIPPTSTAAAPGGAKSGPKGVRLPYSEQNLALLQRGETAPPLAPSGRAEPPSAAPKPLAPPPAKAEPPAIAKPGIETGEDRVDWIWPAGGKVLATFDGAASKGVDIAGKVGDPVYASASGRVVYSGEGIPAYGKLVIIRHNSTFLSAYAHNNQILVKEGQSVAKGQKIAELGATGASQAKLHFEIRRLGKPVDPMQYLPNRAN